MTFEEVFKLLPIKEELKIKILKMYPYMDPAQQLTIQRIAWTNFDLMRQESVEFNTELMEDKIQNGEATYGEDFTKTIHDIRDQELKEGMEQANAAVDLASARDAMQRIIQEMNDAKRSKATKPVVKKKDTLQQS